MRMTDTKTHSKFDRSIRSWEDAALDLSLHPIDTGISNG